jgi:phytoene dehydrogenase-like protein
VSEQPHIEFSLPTLRWPDSNLAPPGKHVLLASAQYAPYHLGADMLWDAERRETLADRVTAKIDSFSHCFSSQVLHRVAFTPRDLENRFGLTEGALSHGELMLDQILFMRPVAGYGRYQMPIAGLYLGGAGTHPGPGIAGGPGWLAANQLLKDRAQQAKAAKKTKKKK